MAGKGSDFGAYRTMEQEGINIPKAPMAKWKVYSLFLVSSFLIGIGSFMVGESKGKTVEKIVEVPSSEECIDETIYMSGYVVRCPNKNQTMYIVGDRAICNCLKYKPIGN